MSPITETELRDAVRAWLQKRAGAEGARLSEEFAIEMGAARVDLALVGQRLEAYELKSDLDDFSRLHNQIHSYNRVFDHITLVAGSAHCDAALEIAPAWWGIIEASRTSRGALRLTTRRRSLKNRRQESRSLAMLLWRDEVRDTLSAELQKAVPARATRYELHEALAQAVLPKRLRQLVIERLQHRDVARVPRRCTPSDGLSHPVANCLDFHCLI